ncbi:MAG: hypothetical protein GF334_04920 [Candidatus Altiarchaeales archaeon]|nr:hypothetical protein [Candidatus Altiarchaeales archaeon]
MAQLPLIKYLRKVLDEHTLPLEDPGVSMIEAGWLVDMIVKVEKVYRANGSLQ